MFCVSKGFKVVNPTRTVLIKHSLRNSKHADDQNKLSHLFCESLSMIIDIKLTCMFQLRFYNYILSDSTVILLIFFLIISFRIL